MTQPKSTKSPSGFWSYLEKTKRSNPWRKNVLVLVGLGYMVVLVIFVGLVWGKEMPAQEAYNFIEAPFMALVGGSLAIAKDLIALDQASSKNDPHSQDEQSKNT